MVGGKEALESKRKMLLYKFFFFNYLLQVSGDDIMNSLVLLNQSDE